MGGLELGGYTKKQNQSCLLFVGLVWFWGFRDKVFLCSPGCLGTSSGLDQTKLGLNSETHLHLPPEWCY